MFTKLLLVSVYFIKLEVPEKASPSIPMSPPPTSSAKAWLWPENDIPSELLVCDPEEEQSSSSSSIKGF